MSAFHAIHPSPYSDDCPDCAGYELDITEGATLWTGRWIETTALVAAALVLVLLLRRVIR